MPTCWELTGTEGVSAEGLSLDDVWPCYCFYSEGIVCGGIWLILCLSREMITAHVGDGLSTAPPDFLSDVP